MKRKILAALLLILCGLASLALREPEKFSREGFAMNTLIRMTVYADEQKILDEAYTLLDRLDKELSMYNPSSDISKINFYAGIERVKVPDEVADVVNDSLRLYKLTEGVFNPLIGPVTRLWKINKADGLIPSQASLDAAVKLSSIENLDIEGNEIFLKSQGCVLDLGGIAKGFASDRIAEQLRASGVKSALIDLGGNVYVIGTKLDGANSNWNIGVRDPASPYGSPALVLSVHDTSVITSGGYERFKTVNGKRYTHFFDVKTGASITNDLLSATVVTPDGSLADGLATAFMASGYEKSLEILKNLSPDVGAVLIRYIGNGQAASSHIEIVATGNLKEKISRERYKLKYIIP